eukprot:EG_transcript_4818
MSYFPLQPGSAEPALPSAEDSQCEFLLAQPPRRPRTWAAFGGGLAVVALALLWAISLVPASRPVTPQHKYVMLPGLRPAPLLYRPASTALSQHFPHLGDVIWSPVRVGELRIGAERGLDLESIERMRIKEIKEELKRLNVGCDDCFEKKDLVQRLYSVTKDENIGEGIVLRMPGVRPQRGFMGPDVKVERETVYFLFDASFPKSPNPTEVSQFIVDTAATLSLITPEGAALYGALQTGYTASGTSAGGEAVTAGYQVSLGSITVDGRLFDFEFKPVVADVPKISSRTRGIIGLDFLARFDVLFDFAGEVSRLYPRGSLKSSPLVAGRRPVPYRVLPIGLLVPDARLVLNGKLGSTVLGILDTGASNSVMNWKAARTVGLTPNSPELINSGMVLAGQDGNLMTTPEVDAELIIGKGEQATPVRIGVGDLPGFQGMGVADSPVMLVGADVLRQHGTMLLCMADRMLWLPTELP